MADSRKTRTGGFTLVELMVVLVIFGLAAAAVVVTMPERGGSVTAEAEIFAARAAAARDQAILRSHPIMLQVGQNGYGVARRADGAWQSEASYRWVAGTSPEVAGAVGANIRFDATGLADPVRIVLRRGGRQAAVDIGNDGGVHVVR
jgi:general secretion pathway protein H